MKIRIAQGAAVLLSIGTLATLLMLGVSLARHPFAAPWVEREAEALALRIDRMIATEVDRDWVDARLEAALAEEPRDWSRIDLVQEIARKEKIPPDPALAARVDSARGSDTEMLRRTKRCLRCALDVADCPDPGTLAACNLPLELTPVGDVNALRRNFGLLLYTGTPDAEGTLGGLVRQARHFEDHLAAPDAEGAADPVRQARHFEDHLADALHTGALCSNDPLCARHAPGASMERRWLHGAACHGCALIAETSCEMRNDSLDRALVVPVPGLEDAAFFRASG